MKSFYRLDSAVGLRVLKRCGYRCKCGRSDSLCVHHIERRKPSDSDYNDESNLTVLCKACHMAYHRKAGHILTSGGRRGNNPPIKCSINGCGRWQHAKALCKK